jgi:hypothetical protein
MGRTEANRRKYRRIPAPIHCRPAGEDFFAQRLEPQDISLGGLRTYSDEPYPVGAFLRLDIFLTGVAPVTLSAEVMWIKPLAKGAPARFDLGLAFVDLKPDALNVLRRVFSQSERTDSAPESQVVERAAGGSPDLSLEFQAAEPVSEVRPVTPKAGVVRSAPDSPAFLGRIPMVLVDSERLFAMKLDGRAGFLVALIDGATSVEALLDLSGMSAQETIDLIEELRRRGIIALH